MRLQVSSSPPSRRRAEACRRTPSRTYDLEVLFEAFVDPEAACQQKKRTGQYPADEQRARQRSDFDNQLALFPCHVFFGRINEDLIILMTGENAAPNEQNDEYGGNDPPGDQKVQYRPVKRGFHGDLPLVPNSHCRSPLDRRQVPGISRREYSYSELKILVTAIVKTDAPGGLPGGPLQARPGQVQGQNEQSKADRRHQWLHTGCPRLLDRGLEIAASAARRAAFKTGPLAALTKRNVAGKRKNPNSKLG